MNDAFTKHAVIFDQIFSSHRNNINRVNNLSNIFKSINIRTILDIGCGGGGFTQNLSDCGFEITGIDISKQMIELARNKYNDSNVKWLCKDFFKFNYKTKYDCTIALYSFIQTLPSNRNRNRFFEMIKKNQASYGYGFVEIQNKKAIIKAYPFNKINSWIEGQFIIHAISTPIDSKSYLLQFTVKDIKTERIIAILKHKIFYISIRMLETILHKNNMTVLKYVDSSDFYSELDINNSLGIGCLFKLG